jgi:hypothetical protein
MVPLIGQLSNRQFGMKLDDLLGSKAQFSDDKDHCGLGDAPGLCCCGCAETVARHRKFVNQDHYTSWLRAQRNVGRNVRSRVLRHSRSEMRKG